MFWEMKYNLSTEEYAEFATKAGLALKSDGKRKAMMVGFLELMTAILGMFFFNGSLIYLIVMFALGGAGLYSLTFYSYTFPNSIKKGATATYKKLNPDNLEISVIIDEDNVSMIIGNEFKEEATGSVTLLYGKEAVVLTSYGWTAIIPKRAVEDFENFSEDLQILPFIEKIAI